MINAIFYFLFGLLIFMLGMYISNIKNKVLNQILKTELENSEKNLSNSVRQLSLCEEKTDKINLAKAELEKNITTLEVENRLLNQKFLEHKTELKELQENLILKFSTSANNLIDEKSQKFTDQNKTSIESLLKPLGENIQRFEELVRQSNNESITRAVSLIEQVKNLSIISAKANKEAENLSRAIKGDIKIQGAWGEIVLERILETAGLVKNREYMVQQSFVGDDGKAYRPDIIINLPQERYIVVDSKVSLTNYERYVNYEGTAETQNEKKEELKNHLNSIRKNINSLNTKSYHKLYGIKTLDFILMFIPIEPAFILAVQNDPELLNYAYEKNIIPVSSTTLLPTLRIISNIWQTERNNKYSSEIAHQSGIMYNKFVDLVSELSNIGDSILKSHSLYQKTMHRLCEGPDNLISRAEKIKELGAKTSKQLDQKILDRTNVYTDAVKLLLD